MSVENASGSTSVTWESHRQEQSPPDLRFLHFNDVYHVEPGSAEPVGGAARFQTVAKHYHYHAKHTDQADLITLFSGDAFNPSLESSVTKGRHMVSILNEIGPDAACVGNHDLDFGVSQFRHLRNKCKFPWLLANVLDPALGDDVSLADCPKTLMLNSSNGIKVGLIGLAEREWLDCINSLPPNLIYKSASATANELAPILRAQGAQIVIAITHAREPSDLKLAEKTNPGLIDLILGGHDHFYGHHYVNKTHILRSGTDFKQLSYIEARRKSDEPGWDFDIIRHDLTRAIPEDEAMVRLVDNLTSSIRSKLDKPIGYTVVPLDGRFTTIRTRESNLGNFICDLMRHYYDTDCALMGSGTIRGDQIYPPGVLLLKDMLDCFPFEDPVVVIRLKGKAILAALENGVSLIPALEGRHPQLSNIQFKYNPALPTGSRVMWVKIHNEDVDLDRDYSMATRGYMTRGKDGYSSLRVISDGGVAEELVSEENGILLSMILRQYFMSLKILGKWARWSPGLHRHWGIVHDSLHKGGKVHEPNQVRRGIKHKRTGTELVPAASGKTHVDGKAVDSDTEDEIMDHEVDTHAVDGAGFGVATASLRSVHQKHRERHIAKVYVRRWMEVVGIERADVGMVDHHAAWDVPHWTRGIAPKVEGRIIIHTEEADLVAK